MNVENLWKGSVPWSTPLKRLSSLINPSEKAQFPDQPLWKGSVPWSTPLKRLSSLINPSEKAQFPDQPLWKGSVPWSTPLKRLSSLINPSKKAQFPDQPLWKGSVPWSTPNLPAYHYNILLRKTTAAQNEVALSYHKMRGLYIQAVFFVRSMVLIPYLCLLRFLADNTSCIPSISCIFYIIASVNKGAKLRYLLWTCKQ